MDRSQSKERPKTRAVKRLSQGESGSQATASTIDSNIENSGNSNQNKPGGSANMDNNYDSVGSRTRSRNYEMKHESHPTGCFAKMKSPTGHMKVESMNRPMDRRQSKRENHPTGCFAKMKSPTGHLKVESKKDCPD